VHIVLMLLTLSSYNETPAELPVCEPPPKKTVVVPCEPSEGCEEKWIFVEKELPIS
jgi:hypothetical protein